MWGRGDGESHEWPWGHVAPVEGTVCLRSQTVTDGVRLYRIAHTPAFTMLCELSPFSCGQEPCPEALGLRFLLQLLRRQPELESGFEGGLAFLTQAVSELRGQGTWARLCRVMVHLVASEERAAASDRTLHRNLVISVMGRRRSSIARGVYRLDEVTCLL